MSNSIDERVVAMKFDNKQFETGVSSTLSHLDKLKQGLKLEGATKGLESIQDSGKRVDLTHIGQGVEAIANKFKALSIVGITTLVNITNQAISTGKALVSSLTIDPIKTGLREYETNLNSIQTVLANTRSEGTKLKNVTDALDELNRYSDQTIYNFSEMARNIGTFTAAGVKLNTSVAAIKGIANLAAISGSNAEQASAAMYQLSQALAAGKVNLMDWNSVVNAGMGGKVFQDSLMETARVHGVAIDSMVKSQGSFRNTLEKGWLTSGILTETLSKFTGDLTEAQLKTMGYNKQQIAGILDMGKTAQDAATKVKTMTALVSTLRESAQSGWAQTWSLILGDFDEAKTLFTNVNNVLGGFISSSAEARNKVVGDWKELGGRTALIDGVGNAFNALMAILKPIKDAFREIFPATTGKQLYDLTVTIRDFAAGLKIGDETAGKLKRTFAGVFALLDIGVEVFKQIIKLVFGLGSSATEGSGGILTFTARVGDFLLKVRNALEEGGKLEHFFTGLRKILQGPIDLLHKFASLVGSLFKDFDDGKSSERIEKVTKKLEPLGDLGNVIAKAWGKLGDILLNFAKLFEPFTNKISELFGSVGKKVSENLGGINLKDVMGGLLAGALTALILTLQNLFGSKDGLRGIVNGVKESLDQLTGTLSSMQNVLRAATLLEIAIAIGILTLSVSKLSKIDSDGLTRSLTALTVMFTQLFGSMMLFEKFASVDDMAKMGLITGAMILLAVALDILASAVKKLADLDWQGLAKGLIGVTVLLAGLIAAVNFMPVETSGLISTSLALIALSAAVKLLASAVKDISDLSWEEMAKGLIGVGALLAALTLFTKFAAADKGGVLQGAGIVLLAAGIKILASAMQDLGNLSWAEIAKGITVMAGALTLIALALTFMPPTSVLSAAAVLVVAASLGMISDAIKDMATMKWGEIGRGLTVLGGALTLIALALTFMPPSTIMSAAAILIVAVSLGMIADALKDMGKSSWSEIAKGLVMLAASLYIISTAVNSMTTAIAGAVALLIVAASLAVLQPILQKFGEMTLAEIGKSLLMLAAVFVVLGVAGAVLTPVVPTLDALGAAILLIGVGVLAAGAGVLLFSAGLAALAVSGAAGAAALVIIVRSMIALLPEVGRALGLAVIAFAEIIAQAGPAILSAITTILLALIDAIVVLAPKIVEALYTLMEKMLDTMLKHVPKMVDTGMKLLKGILDGIAKNINSVMDSATNVITNFIKGIGDNQPRIVQAGVETIIKFINGTADSIRNNSKQMGEAGANLGTAIVEGMARGLIAGAGKVVEKARNIASEALNAAKKALDSHSPSREFFSLGVFSGLGMALGMVSTTKMVKDTSENLGFTTIDTLKKTLSTIPDIISGDIDMSPVITPVLDLSDVEAKAKNIAGLFEVKPINLSTSESNAAQAESSVPKKPDDTDDTSSGTTYNFTQNNTSPKALSPADIYRQTKNQLSAARGV